VLTLCESGLWAAKFHGFNRPPQDAELNVPHAPQIVSSFHAISIVVNNSTGTFPYARQLSLSIEKELTGAYSVVPSGGDGSLSISVLEFGQPSTRTYDLMEYRSVAPTNSQNAILALIPQKFPVTYWESQGQLTLKAVLKDKSGSTIDETILNAPFAMKREIAVNHVATLDRGALPTSDAILTELILTGARSVRRRYAIGMEPIKLKLAVDNELLAGNHMATNGDWEGALRAWDTASMKSNAADREYNMALANYALAFKEFADSQSMDLASSHLAEGSRLLSSAERDDPKEPYFKEAEGYFTTAKLELDKAVQQAKALIVEQERKTEASTPPPELVANKGGKSLNPEKSDTPQELEFRHYIRLQWKKRTQLPTEQELAALKQTGQIAWKLNSDEAEHVVNGEEKSWQERQQKEALYLTNLKAFLNGNTLSSDGRAQLVKLSTNLGLTPTDVAAIESTVPFHEEGKARVSPARSQAAKADLHKVAASESNTSGDKPK
jgi:hypothetical protein